MTLLASRPIPSSIVRQPLDLSRLVAVVRGVAADQHRWTSRIRYGSTGQRWWTQLSADADVDIWLLTWLPGHTTDLHDHGDSAAAFVVVRGRLQEVRAERSGATTNTVAPAGTTTWVAPGVIHDVRALDQPAVSIHAYSPPLTRMTQYNRRAGTLRPTRTVYSAEPEQESQR